MLVTQRLQRLYFRRLIQYVPRILYHLRSSYTSRTFVWLLFLYLKLHIL
nr:MAG TPA: hypothetical protein [Caudoviricetes sp.]